MYLQSPLSGRLTVAVMTPGHYIDGFERSYTDCPWRERHIACDFVNATDPFVWLRAGAHPRGSSSRDTTGCLCSANHNWACTVPAPQRCLQAMLGAHQQCTPVHLRQPQHMRACEP